MEVNLSHKCGNSFAHHLYTILKMGYIILTLTSEIPCFAVEAGQKVNELWQQNDDFELRYPETMECQNLQIIHQERKHNCSSKRSGDN